MTTTERPTPPMTRCPSWCPEPAGHPWQQDQPWNDTYRKHVLQPSFGEAELCYSELLGGWDWRMPGDYGRTFVQVLGDVVDVNGAAQVALDLAEAVAAAVTDQATCAEDTPAIRRVLAERAVLDAVRAWVDGDGTTLAIENAYGSLAAASAGTSPAPGSFPVDVVAAVLAEGGE